MLPLKSSFNPALANKLFSSQANHFNCKPAFTHKSNPSPATPFSGDFGVFDQELCNTEAHRLALYDLAGTPHSIRAGFPLDKNQSEAYTTKVVFSIFTVLHSNDAEGKEVALDNLYRSIDNTELPYLLHNDLLRVRIALELPDRSRE